MTIAAGTSLGPYRIDSSIGAGGMGEVYKATDTRLNRTVAVKVLPSHFAGDPDMRQRFEREAQAIAGLNHPHICTLHDVGEHDGTNYLVMEYVEGETLADRLARGPLSVDEALVVAGHILDALDRAHRQGVVHRDLKPANVMLAGRSTTRSGRSSSASAQQTTKLLDFGLAKWTASEPSSPLAAQPTRLDVTAEGSLVGTLQYMAPEQVEGREADTRTDIFAFGALLYEMLTGKAAFEGKSQASLIGAIMKADPRPISHLQPGVPGAFEQIVARCLVKDPEERWQSAHALKHKLQWIVRNRGGDAPVAEAPSTRRLDRALTAAMVALLAIVSVPAYLYWRGPADPEPVHFRHSITGLSEADFAISPDGQTIAFVAKPTASGASSLYTRPAGGMVSVMVAGTEGAAQPFWSPDGGTIGYVGGNKIRKVAAAGGAPEDVCDAKDVNGAAWSPSRGGTIVFGSPTGLFSVSAEGGQAGPLTELGQDETGHFWPAFLPDGEHLVFLAWSNDEAKRAIVTGALNSKERATLAPAESNPVFASPGASRSAAPGYLFFHRKGTLFAQPFDAADRRFSGDPVQVAGEVASGADGRGYFAVSQNGVLLYFHGVSGASSFGRGRTTQAQWNWGGAGGRLAIEAGPYGDMDLSPDGKLVAVTKQEPSAPTADIWVIDWEKSLSHRVTSDTGNAIDPVWSPDGKRIAFTSYRKGNADVYVKNANGVGEETALLESPMNESVEDWSRDGKYLVFEFGKDSFQDIYALPLDGLKPGKPFPVVQGQYQKNESQFSKDGKWLAYASDENAPGRFEVYVISFPEGHLKQQISTDGGGQPRWSWDGTQIHYRTLNNQIMTVDLRLGAKIEHDVPSRSPVRTTVHPTAGDPTRHMWSVAADGRFLIRAPLGSGGASPEGRGGGSMATIVTPNVTLSEQGGTTSTARSAITNGLTVLLHWPSSLQKAGR